MFRRTVEKNFPRFLARDLARSQRVATSVAQQTQTKPIHLTPADIDRILVEVKEQKVATPFSSLEKRSRCVAKTDEFLAAIAQGDSVSIAELYSTAVGDRCHDYCKIAKQVGKAIRHQERSQMTHADGLQVMEMDLHEQPTSVAEHPTTVRSKRYFEYYGSVNAQVVHREDNIMAVPSSGMAESELVINNCMLYWSWDTAGKDAIPTPGSPLCSRVVLVCRRSKRTGDMELMQVQSSALKQPAVWPLPDPTIHPCHEPPARVF